MAVSPPFPPKCPFCHKLIEAPKELEPKRLGDFAYGRCQCGAVYVYDVTGHNLGAAFSEALGYGCNFDWDLAWELVPDEDYEERLIERYDLKTHKVYPAGRTEDERTVRGVLLFLSFSEEIKGVKGPTPPVDQREDGGSRQDPGPSTPTRHYSKREVKAVVQGGDPEYLDKIAIMASQDPKVLNRLQQLLYTPDPTIRWRAIGAIGMASKAAFKRRPNFVGEFLRRLLYSASDSAATNWGAIEAAGEIIRNIPKTFDPFIRELLALMRFEDSQASVLWALSRIAEAHPQEVKERAFFPLIEMLSSELPEVRGLAARVLGLVGAKECINSLRRLVNDEAEFPLFTRNGYETVNVGELAQEAIDKIEDEGAKMDERELNEKVKEGERLFKEGEVLTNQGRSLDAIEKLEEALSIFEDESYEKGIANCCEKLGDVHCFRGNLGKALPLYQRALTICHKKGDPISEIILIEKIIDLYRRQDDHEKCAPYYMRALEIAESTGDAGKAGYYLTGLGDVYQRQGEFHKALDAYKTAHSIFMKTKALERARILAEGIARIEEMLDI